MNKLFFRVGPWGIALALLALPALGQGAEGPPADLALRGFGTLGLARSDNGNGEFVRDLSQPKGVAGNWSARGDSLLGLQANYRVAEHLEAVVQGVSHYRYNGSFAPELTWVYLKFEPTPGMMLRAGRFGTEFFMLADSRMVGYSYLTVRPAGDFFGTLPLNYVDGLHGRFTRRLGDYLLRTELYSGLAREKLPAKGEVLDLNGSRLNGVSLDIQRGPWQARFSYARLYFQNGVPMPTLTAQLTANGAAAAAQSLSLAGTYVHYRAFGAAYDDGTWQVQADWNSTLRDSVTYEDSTSGYLIAGHRVGKWTPFLGYSRTRSTPKALDTGLINPNPLNTAVAQVLASSHQDQHTLILGARWDFYRNMDLKAQLDIVRGSPGSVALVQNATPAWDGSSKVFSLALDFVF